MPTRSKILYDANEWKIAFSGRIFGIRRRKRLKHYTCIISNRKSLRGVYLWLSAAEKAKTLCPHNFQSEVAQGGISLVVGITKRLKHYAPIISSRKSLNGGRIFGILINQWISKGLALKRAEEISLPFLSCRDFSLRASSLSLCSPSDGKCGEKITAGHLQPVRAPAGLTDPNRPTICKSFRSVYIPSSRYIGNYWCLRFGANLYAKKRKLTTLNFEKFLHGQIRN